MTTDARQKPSFHGEIKFQYGVLQEIEPGLRRLVCRNPGPFTYKGTNTYVIGTGEVAVVDPGPALEGQADVLLQALAGERISHILVTHCHSDHSGAAQALKERTGAELCGAPRRADDPAAGAKGPSGGSFVTAVPFDRQIKDGDRVAGGDWEVEAISTPGHAPDHVCFYIEGKNALLSGDHVMGWNTTVVAPPDGHMGSFIRSLELLLARREAVYYPGHGGLVSEPQRLVKALIMHRRMREGEIIELLRQGVTKIDQLVARMYAGLDPKLLGGASLSVLAHLEWMIEKGQAMARNPGPLSLDQDYALAPGR